MNILLVSCKKLDWMQDSKGTIPLASLYLAGSLRAAGFNPIIVDLNLHPVQEGMSIDESDFQVLQKYIHETDPLMVGFNCFVSQHFPFIMKASDHIKSYNSKVHITTGGSHPSLFPSEIIQNCPSIDSVAIGEAEEQIVAMAQALAADDTTRFSGIQALAYRVDGQVVKNPRVNYISDLDSIPQAAWDLINLEDYYADHTGWHNPKNLEIKVSIPIPTSRSCPFSCNFCACHATMGRMFRRRSPKKVVDEMEYLYKEFGMNYFGFIDDIVNLNKEHLIGICDEILARKMDIQFEPTCGLYLARVDEDIAVAMARAGCTFARLPIESGSDYMRTKIIGKKLPRENIFYAKKVLKDNGIRVSTMSIMGFPEDTPETLQETYDLLLELNADLNYVFNLIPMPGSRVFDQALEENLLLSHFDATNLWRGDVELDPVQSEQQYHLKPRNMTLDELDVFREKFNKIRIMNPELREQLFKENSIKNLPSHALKMQEGMLIQAGR